MSIKLETIRIELEEKLKTQGKGIEDKLTHDGEREQEIVDLKLVYLFFLILFFLKSFVHKRKKWMKWRNGLLERNRQLSLIFKKLQKTKENRERLKQALAGNTFFSSFTQDFGFLGHIANWGERWNIWNIKSPFNHLWLRFRVKSWQTH